MAESWEKDDNLKAPCPICGGVLVVRKNRKNGDLFVGCRSFPSCTMNRPLLDSDEKVTSYPFPETEEAQEGADSYTGTMCSVCHQPQFTSPSGVTCVNGHGGADGIDPSDYRPQDCSDDETVDEAIHKMAAGTTVDPSLLVDVQKMPDRGVDPVVRVAPDYSEAFEEGGDYKIHIQVVLESDLADAERLSDFDSVGIPVDLDKLRMRRDAGQDAAVEVAGRLMPRLVEAVRRVLW